MSGNRDIFDDARRRVTIPQVPGVENLHREGSGLRGPCPLCNASKVRYEAGDTWAGAFQVFADETRWRCHSCHPNSGDVLDLEHALRGTPGQSVRHAAMRLLKIELQDGETTKPVDLAEVAKRTALQTARKLETAKRLWREGQSAAGTLVETYLRARGFHGPVLAAALLMLRFHPAAYHSGRGNDVVRAPAMIGLIMTPWGPTGGVSATYLAPDGSGKAALSPPRKVFGPEQLAGPDGVLRHGGVWLAPPSSPGQLVVGEGIETVGSAAILYGAPARPVATLGLKALQGLWLSDPFGRVDLVRLQPDPAYPGFTWPNPEAHPWEGPLICLDMDGNPIKVRVPGEGTSHRLVELDGPARAAVCASLAAAAWLETGVSGCAFALPPPGMDHNDQLVAALAGVGDGRLLVTCLEDVRPPLAMSLAS
ncbi:DUF7146 domain-containing protein [Brevundimonas sp. CEF1]|uniref:DUF7146 domain-containing protein n=1 Tax=Brevundimonas sp. CEF1 TaxID=3442642 RepID=UPI003F510EBB